MPRCRSSLGGWGFVVLCMLAFGLASGTAAAQRTPPPRPRTILERWLDAVPVSGGVRVGVIAKPHPEKIDPQRLTVFVPSSPARLLCVEISSRDGRYSAKHEYAITDTGSVTLPRPSRYAKEITDYAADELAILAQLGNDCARPDGPFLVASWHGPAQPDTIVVLLNSRVPTFIVGGASRIDHEVRCQSLEGVSTAYNLTCKLPAAWVRPGVDFYVRMRRGTSFTTLPLPLRLPN